MRLVNIRESLLDIDRATDCKHDLTSLYEACKLKDEDKEQLVKYIEAHEDPEVVGQFLATKCENITEKLDDDDVVDIDKFLAGLNDGASKSIYALEDKELNEDTNWRTNPSNRKEVQKYVWNRVRPFDDLTDDNSRFWIFDRAVSNGDEAVLVKSAPRDARYQFSLLADGVDIDIFLGRGDVDTWYVVDNNPQLEEGALAGVAMALGTAAATGFGQGLGDKVGSKLLGEDEEDFDDDVYGLYEGSTISFTCPVCHSKTACDAECDVCVCDKCGTEFWAAPQQDGKVKLVRVEDFDNDASTSFVEYVRTRCNDCGRTNRVEVHFSSPTKPFDDTEYECKYCGATNKLIDPLSSKENIVEEDFDKDDYESDFNDNEVESGRSFFADGYDWIYLRRVGGVIHLDFDNWAVWMAGRPEDENNPEGRNVVGFFIVDEDTGFIDWGPVETVKEAQEFLQSKVDDWENDLDESLTEGADDNSVITRYQMEYYVEGDEDKHVDYVYAEDKAEARKQLVKRTKSNGIPYIMITAMIPEQVPAKYKEYDVDAATDNYDPYTFKEGDQLCWSALYGGSRQGVVTKVTDEYIVVDVMRTNEDTGETMIDKTKYPLVTDPTGKECIIVWRYEGEAGYVYPPSDDNEEDIYSAESVTDELAEEYEDEIQEISQEFTSENTSINSGKLPAIFKMVQFEPGTINIDYGGGRFDNVAEYLTQYDVINLVYDPYNRSAEHNKEVISKVRKAGGADTATCSNVLNVIKEPEVRKNVLENISKLVKSGGKIYVTVYEGSGKGDEGPTKAGYQLNRKTEGYLEEIQAVFPDAKRKGKLIVATNGGSPVPSKDVDESVSSMDDDKDVQFNDKYFPRVDVDDTSRYDTAEYKDKFFAYDKKYNTLIYLFKDDEEVSKFGWNKAPWRELDAAGLSPESWNDPEEREEYLDRYGNDIDDEAAYLMQDFIDNELPYYQKQNEAVSTKEKDLTSIEGTIANVLNNHKDEINRCFNEQQLKSCVTKILSSGECKDKSAAEDAIRHINRLRGGALFSTIATYMMGGQNVINPSRDSKKRKSLVASFDKNLVESEMKESEEDKPYSREEVEKELKSLTRNFTTKKDTLRCGFKEEAEYAEDILSNYYASVELDKVGSWFQVDFKDRLEDTKA